MPKKRAVDVILKNIEEATVEAMRQACVEIMNDLVKAGPAYTGEFSASWYAVAPGKQPGPPRKSSGLYKYTLRNVPKAKFKTTGVYRIVNTSEHADEAMDLVPYKQGPIPEREVTSKQIFTGKRAEGATRGQLSVGGGNTSTAPADWWITYGKGGKLDASAKSGFTAGFNRTFGRARGFK